MVSHQLLYVRGKSSFRICPHGPWIYLIRKVNSSSSLLKVALSWVTLQIQCCVIPRLKAAMVSIWLFLGRRRPTTQPPFCGVDKKLPARVSANTSPETLSISHHQLLNIQGGEPSVISGSPFSWLCGPETCLPSPCLSWKFMEDIITMVKWSH